MAIAGQWWSDVALHLIGGGNSSSRGAAAAAATNTNNDDAWLHPVYGVTLLQLALAILFTATLIEGILLASRLVWDYVFGPVVLRILKYAKNITVVIVGLGFIVMFLFVVYNQMDAFCHEHWCTAYVQAGMTSQREFLKPFTYFQDAIQFWNRLFAPFSSTAKPAG